MLHLNTPLLLHTFVFFILNTEKQNALMAIFSITGIDSQIFFSNIEKEVIETDNCPD